MELIEDPVDIIASPITQQSDPTQIVKSKDEQTTNTEIPTNYIIDTSKPKNQSQLDSFIKRLKTNIPTISQTYIQLKDLAWKSINLIAPNTQVILQEVQPYAPTLSELGKEINTHIPQQLKTYENFVGALKQTHKVMDYEEDGEAPVYVFARDKKLIASGRTKIIVRNGERIEKHINVNEEFVPGDILAVRTDKGKEKYLFYLGMRNNGEFVIYDFHYPLPKKKDNISKSLAPTALDLKSDPKMEEEFGTEITEDNITHLASSFKSPNK